MSEAYDVFIRQMNVQQREFERLIQCYREGTAAAFMSEEELDEIRNQLEHTRMEYSNNLTIETILEKVLAGSGDTELLNVLRNLKVGDTEDAKTKGRAFPRYYDGSYYIEVDGKYLNRIQRLSDYAAAVTMLYEYIFDMGTSNGAEESGEWMALLAAFAPILLDRFVRNRDDTGAYLAFELCLTQYEKQHGEELPNDFFVQSNDIYEAAVAQFVGHEIGHHLFSHTDADAVKKERERLGNEFPDLPGRDWKNQIFELKADDFGVELALEYMTLQYGKRNRTIDIYQLLGVYLPLLICACDAEDLCDDSTSHPAILKRLLCVQRAIEKRTSPDTSAKLQPFRRLLLDALGLTDRLDAMGEPVPGAEGDFGADPDADGSPEA